MSISGRIRHHLQSHVVGYIALFVALSGTALALPGKNSVKSNDIARGAVKGKSLADAAVAREKIRDGAVTSAKLDDGAVLTPKLADAAVTNSKLAEDSVTRGKIGQGEINGGKLANGSVNSAKVADASLLGEDFAAGQLSDGFVVTGSDSGTFAIQRPGRVLVAVAFSTDCTTGPCTYSVHVDGTPVPGAAVSGIDTGSSDRHVTLVGLSSALGAGNHTIELVDTGTATVTDRSLTGILLQ